MAEGSLRCDVNISIRKRGEKKLGTKARALSARSLSCTATSPSACFHTESWLLLVNPHAATRPFEQGTMSSIRLSPAPQVEIKNMNSFSAIAKAIDFEIERQEALTRAGKYSEVRDLRSKLLQHDRSFII